MHSNLTNLHIRVLWKENIFLHTVKYFLYILKMSPCMIYVDMSQVIHCIITFLRGDLTNEREKADASDQSQNWKMSIRSSLD